MSEPPSAVPSVTSMPTVPNQTLSEEKAEVVTSVAFRPAGTPASEAKPPAVQSMASTAVRQEQSSSEAKPEAVPSKPEPVPSAAASSPAKEKKQPHPFAFLKDESIPKLKRHARLVVMAKKLEKLAKAEDERITEEFLKKKAKVDRKWRKAVQSVREKAMADQQQCTYSAERDLDRKHLRALQKCAAERRLKLEAAEKRLAKIHAKHRKYQKQFEWEHGIYTCEACEKYFDATQVQSEGPSIYFSFGDSFLHGMRCNGCREKELCGSCYTYFTLREEKWCRQCEERICDDCAGRPYKGTYKCFNCR